ncbi:MAG: hypothetical protein PWP31_1294 [Clostridia bacterium]|nr:hypothetical protein [Clostridia bacterium]
MTNSMKVEDARRGPKIKLLYDYDYDYGSRVAENA